MKLTQCILTTMPILVVHLTLITFSISLLIVLSADTIHAQLPQDTFFASGDISSVISEKMAESQSPSQSRIILPQTAATSSQSPGMPSYNVTGMWVMGVSDGDLANFNVTLVVAPEDDKDSVDDSNNNDKKYFEISNFRDYRDRYIQLQPSGVVFISGTTSIKSLNDSSAPSKPVDTIIMLDKYYRFQIILDSAVSHAIFNGQPIQGYTTSFINSMGEKIIGAQAKGSYSSSKANPSTPPGSLFSAPPTASTTPALPPTMSQGSTSGPSFAPSPGVSSLGSSSSNNPSASTSNTLPPTLPSTPSASPPPPSAPAQSSPPSSPQSPSPPSPILNQPHPID